MPESPEPNIYQLRVVLLGISPIIWRRLLVRGGSNIADLHDILQISFGWSDDHLHRLLINGKQYGVTYLGGITFRDDPRRIKLSDFSLRVKEKFLYEYDFNDQWRHLIRVEAILPMEPDRFYPVCIGGKRAALPEDCGGRWVFMERRDNVPCEVWERFWRLKEDVEAGDMEAVREQMESIDSMREWLTLNRFDRRAVNRRLRQEREKRRAL
jgi:Plasmid pRiA4b ORF-3-like protein